MSRSSSKRPAISRSSRILLWNNSLYPSYFPTIRSYNSTYTRLLLYVFQSFLLQSYFLTKFCTYFPSPPRIILSRSYHFTCLIHCNNMIKRRNGDILQGVLVFIVLLTVPSSVQIFYSAHCSNTHTHTHNLCPEFKSYGTQRQVE
jgi:hypothetical protein